jgi:hypothetical protein
MPFQTKVPLVDYGRLEEFLGHEPILEMRDKWKNVSMTVLFSSYPMSRPTIGKAGYFAPCIRIDE